MGLNATKAVFWGLQTTKAGLCKLISAFVIRYLKVLYLNLLPMAIQFSSWSLKLRKLILVSLCLPLSEAPKTVFVASRPNYRTNRKSKVQTRGLNCDLDLEPVGCHEFFISSHLTLHFTKILHGLR